MIAFTYTEPTVFYEYMYDTARIARGKGLKVVWISNGYINREPLLDLCPYLDAANIDLKCFEDAMYRKLTGGRLQPVLDTLLTLKEKKIWLEITNLLIPGFSDNPEMITHMCEWLFANGFEDTPLHFSRFYPNYKLNDVLFDLLWCEKDLASHNQVEDFFFVPVIEAIEQKIAAKL
jgi:pyruvate formate lyase activating enzyme